MLPSLTATKNFLELHRNFSWSSISVAILGSILGGICCLVSKGDAAYLWKLGVGLISIGILSGSAFFVSAKLHDVNSEEIYSVEGKALGKYKRGPFTEGYEGRLRHQKLTKNPLADDNLLANKNSEWISPKAIVCAVVTCVLAILIFRLVETINVKIIENKIIMQKCAEVTIIGLVTILILLSVIYIVWNSCKRRRENDDAIDFFAHVTMYMLKMELSGGPYPIDLIKEELEEILDEANRANSNFLHVPRSQKEFQLPPHMECGAFTVSHLRKLWARIRQRIGSRLQVKEITFKYKGGDKMQGWRIISGTAVPSN